MTTIKSKTNFRIALPPPRSKHQQRLHIPPKRLLQLQLLSETLHTSTIFDVIPAAQHSASVQKRILNQLRCPFHFNSGDLVITRSLSEDNPEDGGVNVPNSKVLANEKDTDVVAIIRKTSKDSDRAEISMGTGHVWVAKRLRSGSFEFSCTEKDREERIARWAPKQGSFSAEDPSEMKDRLFTFSLLNPNERRHAVIAKLSPEGVDVCNAYRDPRPVTPPDEEELVEDHRDERPLNQTSEDLKVFILASGAWVGLMEGYSPCFPLKTAASKTHKLGGETIPAPTSTAHPRHIRGHRSSLSTTRVTTSSPAVPQQSLTQVLEPDPGRSFSTGRLDSRGHRRVSGFINKSHYEPSPTVSEESASPSSAPPAGDHLTLDHAKNNGERSRLRGETDAASKTLGRDRAKEEKRFSGVFRGWHRR